MKVLSFGEVLWDIYPNGKYIGGAPFNFASHFKKCGGNAWIVTSVGKDLLGDEAKDFIEKMGVKTDFLMYSDKETGKCIVTLDENNSPQYSLLDNVAYDDIKTLDLREYDFDVLYFGTLSLRNENNRKTLKNIISRNGFGDVFVDINIRPPFYSRETVEYAFENATIIKISEEELPVVSSLFDKEEMTAEEFSQRFQNLKLVIITKGEKGSMVYDCKKCKTYERCAQSVKTVSTVGAGDSFSAAFLAEYLKNNDLNACLDIATKVSGYVVTCQEAIPDYDINNL